MVEARSHLPLRALAWLFRGQVALPSEVDDKAGDHPDTGRAEAVVPPIQLTQRPANERRQEAADVDSDIVDVECPPAAWILAPVEVADLTRQAWQEQSVAERNGRERRVEQRFGCHHEMAERHDAGADDYRAPLAEVPIRDNPA